MLARVEEPFVRVRILSPSEYIGGIQKLCHEKRGEFDHMHFIDGQRVELTYELPLAEMVLDFYEKLKSLTRGNGSLDYDLLGYRLDRMGGETSARIEPQSGNLSQHRR